MKLTVKDIAIPLTYIGGFMIGFSISAHGHLRTDHIVFALGLVLVGIGAWQHFKS